MTARSSIRNRFARTRRTLRRTPARCRLALEALEDKTLLSVTFSPAVNYDAGGDIRSVAMGDFNGDGHPDLVTANSDSLDVSVLLGNGDGSFKPAVQYAVGSFGSGPWSVAVGDFNGDGHPDLVTADSDDSNRSVNVSVLLGNGDGTFQSAVNFAAGSGPHSVAVGDFNGDGHQDLATANSGTSDGSVLLGNGDGSFQSAGNFPVAEQFPSSVAVGDFNGDGRQDLAVASLANKVSVLLGNGDGTFSQWTFNATFGSGTSSVAVGDFNGDGHPDLVTANAGSANVSVLLGNGDGTFRSAVNMATGSGPTSVAVGDFNNDGRQDLATANYGDPSNSTVSVLLGNGDGTFQSAINFATGSGPTSVSTFRPQSVAVGDFDGDGRQDLATANSNSNTVSVLLNTTNFAPTDIALSASSVPENQPSGTTVGTLSTTDPNRGDTFTYALVSGTGSNDNGAFTIVGDQLKTAASFNFEAKSSYSIRVRSTDSGGLFTEKVFTISVTNVNEPPTVVRNRSALTVNEGSPAANTGTFADPEGLSTVTLTASLGTVTQNNTNGTWSWNYTPPNGPASETVTITATDTGGLTATTNFTLTVFNVAPTITAFTVPSTGAEGSPVNLGATATDPGVLDTLTYTWTITRPDGTTLTTLSGAAASFTPPDNGDYGVSLTVSDGDGGTASRSSAPAGMVGWWPGAGNANDVLGFNNGTLGSGVTFAAGEVGQAFNLSGSNQVTVANAPNLNLTTAVTLEAWINPSTLGFNNNFGAVIAKSSGTRRNYGLFVKSNGALHLSYFNAAGTNIFLETAANLVPVGQFSHVAAVIDTGAGVMQLYLNGQLVASRATGGPLVANGVPLTIGLSDPGLDYGFQGLIDEPSVYGRALSQGEIRAIVNARRAGKPQAVAEANVAPTPAISGFTTGLATQTLGYTVSATDPSPVDQAAGFAYRITWGGGTPVQQTIARTADNGSGVSVIHNYTTAGTYTANPTATDKDGGTGSITSTFTVLAVTSANMQTVINQQGSITFQVTTDAQAQAVVTAVNGLAAQATPVTITLNLGAANYTDLAPSPQAGITLVIVGSGGTTTVVGHSPALAVAGGNVVIEDLTLVTDTDSPTVTVSGGSLTLRNVSIQGNGAGSRPAVEITGGTVDLGSADDPGGNTFNANGQGELIRNAGAHGVSAVGDTFEVGGAALSSPYRIKDRIFDALNAGGGGLVTYVPGNAYISVNGGDIQRGVDAIAAGGTVNVEAGSYKQYDAGSKLVTIRFEGGPTLSQQVDPDDPGLRDLVVTGTAGADHIQFTPGGGGVQAQVQGVPNGRFAPTGRLVAYGLAGDDDIEVAGGIALPAFLFGGDGNDRLKAGGGPGVLVGGSGDDTLIGGAGRNVLIGGLGADHLVGGSNDDLLIAGPTAFDDSLAALDAILAEWTSARDYTTRVANLRGTGSGPRSNGDYFLVASGPNATVYDDGAVDVLSGAAGSDWFFAHLSGGVTDIINDLGGGEIVEELDVLGP
jgi:Concanavalin A-like lectin/glucanases superfamily/FG-GAP-like repeat/PKD domain/Cadherin domain/RTX calcium-binding nonapeptide repeat (4 copies)/FG-GAP repeat